MLVTLKSYDKKKKKIKKEFTRLPIAEFAGVKATFVAIGTVKLGVFKRTLSYEGESRLVMPDEIKFEKQYIGQ